MNIAEIIAIICIVELLYVFIGYPVLVRIFAVFFSKPVKVAASFTPALDIVIAAYNEEKLIEGAIRSIYNDSYPPELIKVWVGNDGSSDATKKILSSLQQEFPALSVTDFPRTGKNGVLNDLLLKTTSEITVFMDADCKILPESLRILAAKFSGSEVGAVIGEMAFDRKVENSSTNGESAYRLFESRLRADESAIFSVVSSLGAFYAVRKNLLGQIPNDQVCDDYLPLLRVAAQGKRILYEPDARITEVREKDVKYEFKRIARFTAGGLASVKEVKSLLVPSGKHVWFSFFLWSHKILRWISPFFLFTLFLSSAWSSQTNVIMLVLFIIQSVFYSLAILGSFAERLHKHIPIATFCYFFVLMNISMMIGFFQFLKNAPTARWEPSQN